MGLGVKKKTKTKPNLVSANTQIYTACRSEDSGKHTEYPVYTVLHIPPTCDTDIDIALPNESSAPDGLAS